MMRERDLDYEKNLWDGSMRVGRRDWKHLEKQVAMKDLPWEAVFPLRDHSEREFDRVAAQDVWFRWMVDHLQGLEKMSAFGAGSHSG